MGCPALAHANISHNQVLRGMIALEIWFLFRSQPVHFKSNIIFPNVSSTSDITVNKIGQGPYEPKVNQDFGLRAGVS